MKTFKTLLLSFSLLLTISLTAQVAVNTNGAAANESSMLDVTSASKGILIPRMTATQRDAISSPANGLMVFVTTDQSFYYYNGAQWIKILNENYNSDDEDWTISGNDVYVPSGKKVGVGTSTPDGLLTIENSSSAGEKSLKINNSYAGSGIVYGMYQGIIGSSTNTQYGNYIYFSNGGDGAHYGNYAYISGSGDGNQYGFTSKIYNSGTGVHYGYSSTVEGAGTGDQYGLKNSISNTADGKHYGVSNALSGVGNGKQYGVYNDISNSGTGYKYGTYNKFNSVSNANMYGTYNQITASGNGNHYGMYNYVSGTGSGDKYGLYTGFSSTAGGKHYGVYINAPGGQNYAAMLRGKTYTKDNTSGITVSDDALATIDASGLDTTLYVVNTPGSGEITYGIISNIKGADNGNKYAIYNVVENTGNGAHVGVFNKLTGSAAGYQYGVHNDINNTGASPHYGNYSTFSGTGTGANYGSYADLAGSGNGTHYGNYATLSGSGSGDKIGSFVEILSGTGGVHYGFKCDVTGSSNYAGYFDGRIYVSESVGIGVPSPTVKLDVDGDVQFKNTSADAVVDIESTSGDATLNIKAASSSDLAQIKLYNASTEKAWIGYDEANNRVFIKEGIKNVFIDNGNINPEVHKTQNLGYYNMAWNNIYYDDLIAQGSAAFVNRNVTKELLAFPPKEKTPGSFDYQTKRGEVELDPSSLPKGLHYQNAILTDEMVSYNYKANYEQQLQIEELKEVIKKQNEKIEALLKMLSKDK